ncbi:hypothetical protein FNH22_30735 [Fulvivirga sp. M361]|uniref:hypothetical protein n=1 Tax=Fulvivirga sp. M361 TaxID=2594266 RepID=UPI00117A9B1B|nr:hypothetical protein [Fulvivirga sp. M361]TRX46487.1 hypothetical protein FNH22_30735 [Fulvivirga sp. M361]
MKNVFITLITLLPLVFSGVSYAQKNKISSLSYEVKAIPGKSGVKGTVLFKVFSYGKNASEAIERGKRDAVHAVIFRGIPASNYSRPLIDDPDLMFDEAKYFKSFFGVKDLNSWQREKKAAPSYLNYVSYMDHVTINPEDITDLGKTKKIGVPVQVNVELLRSKLAKDGFIKKGIGF